MSDKSYACLDEAFSDCYRRLERKWRGGVRTEDSRISNLEGEALKRLVQVQWCLKRVMTLDDDDDDAVIDSCGEEVLEIETMAEAFYYFAARFLDLCSDVAAIGLRGVKCKDIRTVRDHLIEHANKHNGVTSRNIVYGCEGGIQLKPWGEPGQRPKHRGLYCHAAALINSLRTRLDEIEADATSSSREP